MKKIIIVCIVSLLVNSCIDDIPTTYTPNSQISIAHQPENIRSVIEAIDIAAQASKLMSPNGNESGLSRGYGRTIDYNSEIYTISSSKSRSVDDSPLMYVINYTDNNGFAITQRDKTK